MPPHSRRGHVNAHTHIYSALAPFDMPAPQPPPESFLQILERVWWRLDRALDEQALAAGADYYVAEALMAGTTCLIDHHESPNFIDGSLDVLAEACQRLGMPAVLCYGATERNRGRDEARAGLAECERFLRTNERPLVRGAVGLHASFTVSDDTIGEAAALARSLGAVLHLHVAEGPEDVADARRRGDASPLARLRRLDALVPGSILVHGVYLTAEEVAECEQRGLWLVQNPRSNRGNGVGYPRALTHSRCVALGTDGYPADMNDEVAALFAEAEEVEDESPRLGNRLGAGHDLCAALFGGEPPEVDVHEPMGSPEMRVDVAGREVVAGGELLTGDRAAFEARARTQAERLWQRMAAL